MKKLGMWVILVSYAFMTVVAASTVKVESTSDKLEIGEAFGNVIPSFTVKEIPELQGGTITTQGSTKYNQYLRFSGLPYPSVVFEKDDNNYVGPFLYVPRNTGAANAFFEYELEFESGLQSSISDDELADLDGKQIYLFNQPYTITLAALSGNKVSLEMVGGPVTDFIEKGQTKQFALQGKTYNVKVSSIESSTKKVRLAVDGQNLPDMVKGEISPLSDGKFIGVSKVLISTSVGANDMVEVFLGATVIELKDTNYGDQAFVEEVKIDNVKQQGAFVDIEATLVDATTLKISKIKYRLTSTNDIKAKPEDLISVHLGAQKRAMLAQWDMRFSGLSTGTTSAIAFTPTSGDDEYVISFKNRNGESFTNIPFLSNIASFKLGDSNNDLIIQEGVDIGINDYFIITNRNDKTGTTYVLRYTSIDTTQRTFKVFDYASNSEKTISYQDSSISGQIGTAEITIGSLKANTTILSSSGNPLRVDLNTDGSFGSNVVYIVANDGGILITQALAGNTYALTLRTESSQFEENATDENIQFTFEARGGNKIGAQNTFTGITTKTKDSNTLGLSGYGVKMAYTDPGGNEAETLSFDYPKSQKFAEVYIEVGAASIPEQTIQTTVISSCSNGMQDGDETGIDCGGSCPSCAPEQALPSCSDGIQNQGETGTDCGGPCRQCGAAQELCPNGCVYAGTDGLEICMFIGETTETIYCGSDGQVKLKKSNGLACTASYECKIGLCENGTCGKDVSMQEIVLNVLAIIFLLGSLFYILETLITIE